MMKRSREARKAEWLEKAEAVYDELLAWEEQTEKPTLTQIEEIVLELRKRLGEELAQDVVQEQEARQPVPGPKCAQCGQEMEYKGLKKVKPQTWAGDLEIERGHYYCPQCKTGFFPPR
jgi:hypothetical protein